MAHAPAGAAPVYNAGRTIQDESLDSKPAYRLTSTSYAVLSLLELLGEATSYDLKQALMRSIENFWPVPHTTFYEEPARLANAGYLSARQEPSGRRRRLYELTESGRAALREWALDPEVGPQQLRDEAMLKVFAGGDPVAVFARRAQWHREKLAELEEYLGNLRDGQDGPREDRWRGAEVTLIAGTSYHRQMLELLDRFLAESDAGAVQATASAVGDS
jgi:PadR family transcriptional regulator, regulatory protein AphA